jgi:hypothetical protein
MRMRLLALALALAAAAPALAQDKLEEGSVIWHDRRCAFFIVQSPWGFTLFEYLNGPWPSIDDVIEGKLEGFGMRNVVNRTVDNQTTVVYSEISSTSKKWVGGKIPGFCKRKKDFLGQIEAGARAPAQGPAQQ